MNLLQHKIKLSMIGVKNIIINMKEIYQLAIKLMHSCSFRIKEIKNIRIKNELKVQAEKVKELHKKLKNAKDKTKWQYIFPMIIVIKYTKLLIICKR